MRKKICSKCGAIANMKEHKCEIFGKVMKPKRNKHDKDYDNSDSTKWRKFRKQILARDYRCCVRCWQKYRKVVTNRLEVHQIKPKHLYKHLTYEEGNCITLCVHCHREFKDNQDLDFEWNKNDLREVVL